MSFCFVSFLSSLHVIGNILMEKIKIHLLLADWFLLCSYWFLGWSIHDPILLHGPYICCCTDDDRGWKTIRTATLVEHCCYGCRWCDVIYRRCSIPLLHQIFPDDVAIITLTLPLSLPTRVGPCLSRHGKIKIIRYCPPASVVRGAVSEAYREYYQQTLCYFLTIWMFMQPCSPRTSDYG